MLSEKHLHHTKGRRTGLRRTGIILLVAVAMGMVVLWFMFQHKPAWYRPVQLDAAAQKQARKDATNFIDSIGDRMVRGEAFDVVLIESRLNDWLAMMPEFASGASAKGSDRFTGPVITFADDRLRFGIHYQNGGLRAIISVTVLLAVSPDGRSMMMKIESMHGGSLPAPESLIASLLEPALNKARERSDGGDQDQTIAAVMLEKVDSIDDLFEGIERRNRFIWPNGRRLFTFESIEIHNGEMRLRIKPL